MTSRQQGWYWIGLGVLGLGLSSSPASNSAQWLSDLSDRAEMVTASATDELTSYVDCATSSWQDQVQRVDARQAREMGRAQARIARMNASFARQQAAFARLEAAKVRMIDVRIPKVKVMCPRQRIVVDVPQISIEDDGNL